MAEHQVKVALAFTKRRDFLALKNAVAGALTKAKGSINYVPLQKLLDDIEKQAEKQDWKKLPRDQSLHDSAVSFKP